MRKVVAMLFLSVSAFAGPSITPGTPISQADIQALRTKTFDLALTVAQLSQYVGYVDKLYQTNFALPAPGVAVPGTFSAQQQTAILDGANYQALKAQLQAELNALP